MATEESNVVQKCRIAASKKGARVFRNNRGLFLTIDCLKTIMQAAGQFGVQGVKDVISSGRLRKVRAGLEVPGGADLIGWHSIEIKQEMVGKTIAVFLAPEVKRPETANSKAGRATVEQMQFINNVNEAGGIAGIVRGPEDMGELIDKYMNNMLA